MKNFKLNFVTLFAVFATLASLTLAQTPTTTSTTSTETNDGIATGNQEIYEGLVFGVGKGTFAVFCFAILGIVICLFKDCSQTPTLCVFLGAAIPLLVLGILLLLPVKSLDSDTVKTDELPTDNFMIKTFGVFLLILTFSCCLVCLMLGSGFTTSLVSQKINSTSMVDLAKLKVGLDEGENEDMELGDSAGVSGANIEFPLAR